MQKGNYLKENDVGILGSILGKREPVVAYRTVDGGHPAPFPDMTDEQLYNYEMTFNVPRKTFDQPPPSVTQAKSKPAEPQAKKPVQEKAFDAPRYTTRTAEAPAATPATATIPIRPGGVRPLDLGRPVRTVTTKQPVDIITTRARHPIYKVHGYIGDDDVVTVFTLDGRLSENGPQFLENVPQKQQLHLNIYRNREPDAKEKYLVTQHDTKEEADAHAQAGRIACVAVQFDL